MIDEKATFKKFGYYPSEISLKSNKKIVVVCDRCGEVRIISKSSYRDLCKKCASKKRYEDHPVTDVTREKIRVSTIKRFKDNPISDVTREKMRLVAIKRYEDSEAHKITSDALKKHYKDHPVSDKFRLINGERIKQHYVNHPEARERAREKTLKQFEDPIMRENARRRTIEQMESGFPNKNTSIELKMQGILTKNDYKYQTQVPVCNVCFPDIVFKAEQIAIFCDGDYWHNRPGSQERDENQDRILLENGWIPLRFWEHEINENIEDCFYRFELEYFGGEC